jgi:hypothetical protein
MWVLLAERTTPMFPYKGSAEVKENKLQNLLKKSITVAQVALVVLGCLLAFAIASG